MIFSISTESNYRYITCKNTLSLPTGEIVLNSIGSHQRKVHAYQATVFYRKPIMIEYNIKVQIDNNNTGSHVPH